MTPDELMKPRYKVIADYFYNPYKIGDIITVESDRSVHLTTTHYRDEFGETVEMANYFNPKKLLDYPHLFKPLAWWEEINPDNFPLYVRYGEWDKAHAIYKIEELRYSEGWAIAERPEGYDLPFKSHSFYPATEAEYNAYINQINK